MLLISSLLVLSHGQELFLSRGAGPSSATASQGQSGGIFYEKAWYKCLDLPGGNTQNGNKIQIWDCNGKSNQAWVFDSWQIHFAGDTSKCLDVPGGDLTNGNQLQIWDCNGQDSQSWGYDSNMQTIYLAHSMANVSDASKCMDLKGGDSTNGNLVEVWDCNGYDNQKWTFKAPSPSPGPSNECVDAVNKYRKMAGKPALPACADQYFDAAKKAACYDINNAHASCHSFASSFCPGGHWAGQNEGAPKFNGAKCTWDDEVKCWYDEKDNGPGASGCCKPCTTCNQNHYKALIGDHSCVACGYCESGSGWQWTGNFCRN